MMLRSRGVGVAFAHDVDVIASRVQDNRAEGIGVEDSQRVVVRDNVSSGNAGGIAALDLPGGRPLDSVTISGNDVTANDRFYPGDLALSGLGVVIAGASRVVVSGNRIWNNTARASAPLSGGIRIISTRPFGGPIPATSSSVGTS